MFFTDDIILRSLGVSLPPGLDMIGTIEEIQKLAHKEMYNPEKIKGQIKENRLLYEFGELTREEYERTNAKLMQNLRMAEEA
ncbi:MAG: gas vesicle protein GvpG [Methanotrichaceae archaeon]